MNIFVYHSHIFIMGVIFLNNIDINKMLEMLSKMDKNELEAGIAKANKILNSNYSKDDILKKTNFPNNK